MPLSFNPEGIYDDPEAPLTFLFRAIFENENNQSRAMIDDKYLRYDQEHVLGLG